MAKVASKKVNAASVGFSFANDETREFALDGLSQDIINRLAVHGLSQKIGDSYASSLTVAAAVEKADATYAMLKAGDWALKREGGTGGVWIEAIARVQGIELSQAATVFDKLDEAQKKGVKGNPRVKAAKLAIDAERAAKRAEAATGAADEDNGALDIFK